MFLLCYIPIHTPIKTKQFLDDRTKETKEVEFCNMHVIKELLLSALSKYEDIIQARRKYPTK